MSSSQIVSYSPYTGGIYEGDISGKDMAYADMFESQKLAELIPQPYQLSAGSKGMPDEAVPASVTGNKFKVQLSASLREAARIQLAEKEAKKALFAGTMTPGQYSQYHSMQQQKQLIASTIDARSEYTRVVPRLEKILGLPPSIYFLETMFTRQAISKLDAKIAEQDGIGMTLQLNPTESANADRTDFDEHYFHLKRNSLEMIWSFEGLTRSDADLRSIDMRNANIAKSRARELLALVELSKLETSASLTINDPKAKEDDVAVPRSKFNPVEDLAKITTEFNVNKSSNITHIAWNPIDFVAFASNYYTMQTAFTGPQYSGYGVVQTPKMPHITSVISPLVPRGYAYAVDHTSVFLGEGPLISETEHVASKLSDVGYMHDFCQFVIPNPKRFGLKIEIGGVSNADKGTEVSTIEAARRLTTPKVQLARKA